MPCCSLLCDLPFLGEIRFVLLEPGQPDPLGAVRQIRHEGRGEAVVHLGCPFDGELMRSGTRI